MPTGLKQISEQEKETFRNSLFVYPFVVDTKEVEFNYIAKKNIEIYKLHFPSFNWNNTLHVFVIARLTKFLVKDAWKFTSSIEFDIESLDDSIKIASSLLPVHAFIIGDISPREGSTDGYESLADSLNTLLINFLAVWENGFRCDSQKYAKFCHQLDEFCLQMIGG